MIYAPIAPLILPIGALRFALFWCCYRYYFLCIGRGLGHCRGQIHLQMPSQTFWGIYTQQACTIGLLGIAGWADQSTTALVHLALRIACFVGTVWLHHLWRAACKMRLQSATLPALSTTENSVRSAPRMVQLREQGAHPRDMMDDVSGVEAPSRAQRPSWRWPLHCSMAGTASSASNRRLFRGLKWTNGDGPFVKESIVVKDNGCGCGCVPSIMNHRSALPLVLMTPVLL